MSGTPGFDVDEFLSGPRTARVATLSRRGAGAPVPAVRPVWFRWEDGSFWILTGPWAGLLAAVRTEPAVALVVDVCEPGTGLVRQVIASGSAEIVPFDVPRGRRLLAGYLGPDPDRWDPRFRGYLYDDPAPRGTVWLRVRPDSLSAKDLSYAIDRGDGAQPR